jgi:adenosine deaminase
MEEHPVKQYLEHGVFITLNSDDPTIFNTSLVGEYWNLHDKMGIGVEHLFGIIVKGFVASFMDERAKRGYIKRAYKTWSDIGGKISHEKI